MWGLELYALSSMLRILLLTFQLVLELFCDLLPKPKHHEPDDFNNKLELKVCTRVEQKLLRCSEAAISLIRSLSQAR